MHYHKKGFPVNLNLLASNQRRERNWRCLLVGFGMLLTITAGLHAASTDSASTATDEAFEPIEVNISPDLPYVVVDTPNGEVQIQREQDQANTIEGDFARTSRPCPPFCIQPMQVAEGVHTIGELELLQHLQDPARSVLDSRTLEWYLEATIPGSIHMPYTDIAGRLDELGCERADERWNCSNARMVTLFCNGPWCGQSPTAIRAMLREGYPADRISYYRGGMQLWQMLGLNVVEGDF